MLKPMASFLVIFLVQNLACAKTLVLTTPHKSWAKTQRTRHYTITTLNIYYHDKLGGPNATSVQVLPPKLPSTSFGRVVVADVPLRVGPDPRSKIVGRAQGSYFSVSSVHQESALLMVMTLELTDGIYNGSSFSILGRNPFMHPAREFAVVGGTGLFRWGHGYVVVKTYSFDEPSSMTVVKYEVTIVVDDALKNIV